MGLVNKFLIMAVAIIVAMFAGEIFAWAFLGSKPSMARKSLLLDLGLLKKMTSPRIRAFRDMKKHYYMFDPTLGYRMRPGARPFNFKYLLKKMPTPLANKNFFEITIDDKGFIAHRLGEERDYAALAKDNETFKILISGNSTTAGSGASCPEANWPAILQRMLEAKPNILGQNYKRIAVINSSALGYKIAQELKRFQEETIYLNPHMLIVFNGVKEPFTYQGNPVDYATHMEQHKAVEHFNFLRTAKPRLLLPNLREVMNSSVNPRDKIKKVYPYRDAGYLTLSAPELFLSKVRQFKGICDTHNIDFHFVLQPVMGLGEKTLSMEERELIPYFERYLFGTPWEQYLTELKYFYSGVQSGLSEKYQHDFTGIFDGIKEAVYSDPRHFNDHGQNIIAGKVYDLILSKVG